jgi:hypothetical protein
VSVQMSVQVAALAGRARRVMDRLGDERLFALCLLGLAVAIAVFLVAPLTPGFAAMHHLPTNRDIHVEGKDQGGVTGFWVLSVLSFLLALWRWRQGGRPSWRLLLAGAVLLHLLAMLVPPVASEDVYAYSFYGAVQRDYGTNPYLAFPDQHPLHPWFPFWSWRDIGPVYGPPFLLVLRGVAVLAGPSLLAWVIWMKVLLVAAEAAGIWALVRAMRPVPGSDQPPPQAPGWPVLLLAWNPMVLQSIAMSAHVDALLLLLVGLAVLAHRRARPVAAFVLLAVCFVVKLYMGPLAALYAIWLAMRREPGRAGPPGRPGHARDRGRLPALRLGRHGHPDQRHERRRALLVRQCRQHRPARADRPAPVGRDEPDGRHRARGPGRAAAGRGRRAGLAGAVRAAHVPAGRATAG